MSCQDRAAGSAKRTCARTCATCGQRSTSTHLQQSLVQLQALLDCCLASNPLPIALRWRSFSWVVLPRLMERLLGCNKLVGQFGELVNVVAKLSCCAI